MPTDAQAWTIEARTHQEQLRDLVELLTQGDVVHALHVIDELCDVAEYMRMVAVRSARRQGVTWEEIGTALGGLSRQAVWERYRGVIDTKKQFVPPPVAGMNGTKNGVRGK